MYESSGFEQTDRRGYFRHVVVLAGLFLTGLLFSSLVAYVLIIPLFDINLFTNPYALSDYDGNANQLNALRFVQLVASIGAFLVPPWIVAARRGNVAEYTGLNKPAGLKFLVAAIGVLFISNPLVTSLVQWNQGIVLPDFMYPLERILKEAEVNAAKITGALTASKGIATLVANLLVVAVLPAFAEEFFFRGVLQRLCIGWTKSVWGGILISSFLFSAIHFQFYGFFPRMLMGVFMGWLFYCSGSLWTNVLYHFINNSVAVLIVFFDLDKTGGDFFSEEYIYPFPMLVLSVAATFVLMYYIYKKRVPDGTQLEQRF